MLLILPHYSSGVAQCHHKSREIKAEANEVISDVPRASRGGASAPKAVRFASSRSHSLRIWGSAAWTKCSDLLYGAKYSLDERVLTYDSP